MKKLNFPIGVILLAHALTAAFADDVTFGGRNFMEGELKYMERGRLYFKTPATDTIYIDWQDVAKVTSTRLLEVELQSGILFYGSLVATEDGGKVALRRSTDVVPLELSQIVRITPIEENFLARFDGKLSTGLNLNKANDYRQFDLGLNLEYVTRRYESNLTASSLLTNSEGSDSSKQNRLAIASNRKLDNRWRTGGLLEFESNDELGIKLRSSVGWGIGRALIQTNSQRFMLAGGLLLTQEKAANSGDSENNIESFGAVQYQLFRYADPEVDLVTGLRVIPSLTDAGRVRGDFDITLSWEIINDLDWQLTFRNAYDSSPPAEARAKNDYSVITGLSWDI